MERGVPLLQVSQRLLTEGILSINPVWLYRWQQVKREQAFIDQVLFAWLWAGLSMMAESSKMSMETGFIAKHAEAHSGSTATSGTHRTLVIKAW